MVSKGLWRKLCTCSNMTSDKRWGETYNIVVGSFINGEQRYRDSDDIRKVHAPCDQFTIGRIPGVFHTLVALIVKMINLNSCKQFVYS